MDLFSLAFFCTARIFSRALPSAEELLLLYYIKVIKMIQGSTPYLAVLVIVKTYIHFTDEAAVSWSVRLLLLTQRAGKRLLLQVCIYFDPESIKDV